MLNGILSAKTMPVTRWVMDVTAPTGSWIWNRLKNAGLRPFASAISKMLEIFPHGTTPPIENSVFVEQAGAHLETSR
jgi:hypothetical protein